MGYSSYNLLQGHLMLQPVLGTAGVSLGEKETGE